MSEGKDSNVTNDLSVFWRNNVRAYELFRDLLARAERNAFDDDFLAVLAAYREAAPASERADIFAALYLLACGDAENAALCGERAFQKRPLNFAVWHVLSTAYSALGRERDALTIRGYIQRRAPQDTFCPTLPRDCPRDEALSRLTMATNMSSYAPLIIGRAVLENGAVQLVNDIYIGEEIPTTMPSGSDRFWVGIFVDEGFLSMMSYVHEPRRHELNFFVCNRDATFDIQKARESSDHIRIDVPAGEAFVVPVAGTKVDQRFSIQTAANEYPGYLGKWAFSYFRLTETATLRSDDAPFAVGTPIRLGHSPHRKKLVLNLLIDGLCWPAVRPLFAEYMPHIAKFFARGVIFDQHFSAAEHTLSALPTIETGLYSHHTQIFHESDSHELPLAVRTLSEEMQALGYYCSAPLVTGQLLYYGLYRGYQRLISTHGFQPTYEGTERVLRTLEALPEVDHFMLYHTSDVHPLNVQMPPKFSTEVEAHIPLADRFVPLDPTLPSVRTPRLPIYLGQLRVSLRHIDRSVGALLSYIEEHYDENEYIVNLYSDHGCALFDPDPAGAETDLIGEYATGATWMIRGAGVPEGIITDELTSSVDIYPTLGKLCGFPVADGLDGNLPAVFGGRERDAAYSVSQFPGQTFKLAIRTRDHVLRVETRGCTAQDGTADFADAEAQIYLRGHELNPAHIVDSAELRTFFYPRARDFVREISNNGELFVR